MVWKFWRQKKKKAKAAALIEALKNEDKEVRVRAAKSLRTIGPEAVPALIEALKDEDERVRWFATWTLQKIITPEAWKALEEHFKKSN